MGKGYGLVVVPLCRLGVIRHLGSRRLRNDLSDIAGHDNESSDPLFTLPQVPILKLQSQSPGGEYVMVSSRIPRSPVAGDEEGATAVEYALMVALIALVTIAAVTALGLALPGLFDAASDGLN